MAQQALHGVQVDAGFEQVGGEGVAQGVDAALFLDARPELRHRVDLLGDGVVKRTGAVAIGEEPDAGRRRRPVRAQILEEARGERHVAIFGALAGLDADRHAVGVDVRHPERNRLAHAQPCAIDGGEQQPMTWMRGRGEQSPHLFPAQNLRQFLRLLREGDVEVGARMTERHVIEEPEGVGRLTARAPGHLPLQDQMGEVCLNLVVR